MVSKFPSDQFKMQGSKKEACDCCQNCKAAKNHIESKEKEGAAIKDGCEDCCKQCGTAMPPTPDEIPPEIIDNPNR
jgi:hypothetical protein